MLSKKGYSTSLLRRMMCLALLPVFLVQIFSFYIFFRRYWVTVSVMNITYLAEEITILNRQFDSQLKDGISIEEIVNNINNYTKLTVEFARGEVIEKKYLNRSKKLFLNKIGELNKQISKYFSENVVFYAKGYNFILEIEKNDGLLMFKVGRHRLHVTRLDLIIFWNFLSLFLISAVAIIFTKNQVRSINTLKNFVNDFSFLEKENSNFKPTGAREVREIGRAFINMINKMKYVLNSRTTMLAQISHDLRTPLTRMKLQTEFIKDKAIANFFRKDLAEMEQLINEYILFAKGENSGEYVKTDIEKFFNEIMDDYRRSGYNNISVNYSLTTGECFLKKISFKRAINNLINNSLRYCKKKVIITVKTTKLKLFISVEDDGDTLTKEDIKNIDKYSVVFKNKENKTGNGLGLSIVQQVTAGHGGTTEFSKSSKLGGLMVLLTIPINKMKR